MWLLGDESIATSILVIPCHKHDLSYFNLHELNDNSLPIIFGDFAKQCAYAKKCMCCQSPCTTMITPDLFNRQEAIIVPMCPTWEDQKASMESAKKLIDKLVGNERLAILLYKSKLEAIKRNAETTQSKAA